MKTIMMTGLAALWVLAGCGAPEAGTAGETDTETNAASPPEAAAETESATGADFAEMNNWLCHPGKTDSACDSDLSYTVVNADGSLDVKPVEAAANPPIDCFYVYPTISFDTTPNSDLAAGPEEKRVAASQFGAFKQACRLFAPVYRQITLTHLQSLMRGGEFTADPALAYGDVKAAWEAYLETENDGRGVVLIGHSQGARMVEQLLKADIIGSDAERLIVSAMPVGYTIYGDAETGGIGPFAPCETIGETGCTVAYVSFRSDAPPPEASRFGESGPEGQRALCVNPAGLTNEAGSLDARLSRTGFFGIENASFVEGARVTTPYAALPGMLSAECVEAPGHTYLAIDVKGDPADPRADDILGDVVVEGEVLSDWGLHLIDMSLAMGNLVAIVEAQAESWTASASEE